MSESLNSFKSFEDVRLKATYNIEINGRTFSPGETIATFDKIQISGLNEVKDTVAARGGLNNVPRVFWDKTKQLNLTFSQGVFSQTQFALLNNASVLKFGTDAPVLISKTESLESDENCQITTTKVPYDQIYVYDASNMSNLTFTQSSNVLTISTAYKNVIVSYRYSYTGGGSVAHIGQTALNGFLELEGKTRVKDDTSGLITTGIIKIPQLKLMSSLSIKLGANSSPVVGNFNAIGVPVDMGKDSYVMEFYFLNNDIDSDM